MSSIDVEIEIEVQCECGNELTVKHTDGGRFGFDGKIVLVEPCEDCAEKAEAKGYETGWDEAKEDSAEEDS